MFFTKSNPQQQILHLLIHHQAKQRKVVLKNKDILETASVLDMYEEVQVPFIKRE